MDENIRVLIGSSIRQDSHILKEFLTSLKELDRDNILVDYFFIDDNESPESKDVLKAFSKTVSNNIIIQEGENEGEYICTDDTHLWKEKLIWKVAEYKNRIIEHSKNNRYNYLFLIDSDLVLHPKTLKHLISLNKEIISEIFWTKWKQYATPLPQVWVYDEYSLIPKSRNEILSDSEKNSRYLNYLEKLKKTGVYEVGGLGACTLVSSSALEKGVNYDEIYNLSFWGEDRHFCIRAVAMGIKLYVDTTYPAYHIYRKKYLIGVEDFKHKCRNNIYYHAMSILETEARAFAKEFLESFYSCDYTNISIAEGSQYLTPQYINELMANQNTVIKFIIANKVICNVDVLKVAIDRINSKNTEALIKCKFRLTRKVEEKIIETYFNCTLLIKMQGNSQWKVYNIELINDYGQSIIGYSITDLLEEKIRVSKVKDNKITLAMLVRNESEKFIRQVLSHASKYIDNAVILDDASDDDTVEVCKDALKNIPLTIISNEQSGFDNEILLRKQLWQMTIDTKPDWILFLDADEIFEDKIIESINLIINQRYYDYYCFRLYDMWDESHYREDDYWQAHKIYRPFIIRYQPNFNYAWNEKALHCGRLPSNIFILNGECCEVRLKHLGWSTKKLREDKYKRYLELDPEGKYGNMEQYISILKDDPNLVEWK